MRGRMMTLGLAIPGRSGIHRAPLWAKYLVVLAFGVCALAWREAPVALALIGLTVLLYAAAGRRVLACWADPLRYLWWMFAILGAHQWWLAFSAGATGMESAARAVAIVGGMLAALQAARLLLLVTELTVLMDGLGRALRPLRHVGIDPEALSLGVSLMLRSIPAIAASAVEVGDAARARGIGRNPVALAGPVVVSAIDYAHRTGDALAARGLLDHDDEPTG
ncbi:energy-coupling factor transporter transmembrane component T family protein [Zhihengliuella salsuginis]|nr:energy-coupling factor transporter transmembrane component T [Zhihengliuella salsuginis]